MGDTMACKLKVAEWRGTITQSLEDIKKTLERLEPVINQNTVNITRNSIDIANQKGWKQAFSFIGGGLGGALVLAAKGLIWR